VNPHQVTRDFEKAIADYTGAADAVTCTSCTLGLLMALALFRCRYGVQAVEIPRFTYVGVGMSILNAGHHIAFRDEDWRGEYRMVPFPLWDSARRFTSGMHKPGQMEVVSFHWGKILGLSQGGAILTDDADAAAWLRRARFDGRTEGVHPRDDVFDVVGFHGYLSPEVSAHGLMKLALLPRHNADLPPSDYSDLSRAPIFCGRGAKPIAVAAE
jgi:dTDP-4-amino-4,6-dideoxygalactose transaminase